MPEARIAAIVEAILGYRLAADDHARPLRRIGVDSTRMIELILALESEFRLGIPDEDIGPEHFASIAAVARYVQERI